jgi:hypothetical protein
LEYKKKELVNSLLEAERKANKEQFELTNWNLKQASRLSSHSSLSPSRHHADSITEQYLLRQQAIN